eukprot:6110317-Ditylum_brightwellii.AAC.1
MAPNGSNGTVNDNNDVMEVKKSYVSMATITSPHWCKAYCITTLMHYKSKLRATIATNAIIAVHDKAPFCLTT